MKVEVQVIGVQSVVQYLRGIFKSAKKEIADVVRTETGVLQGAVRGAAPRQTGKLARAVHRRTKVGDTMIVGTVSVDHPAAPSLEFGFDGQETVREHLRKTASGSSTVRTHVRRVHFPKKPFIFPTQEANQDSILAHIQAALDASAAEGAE